MRKIARNKMPLAGGRVWLPVWAVMCGAALLFAGLQGAPARAAAVACTEIVGFSQTAGWFNGGFLNDVAAPSTWQLRWVSGGDMQQWGQASYAGWSQPVEHPCATNSNNPDRVIYNATRAAYIDHTGNFAVEAFLHDVIAAAHANHPTASVYIQPVIAGPSLHYCDWPITAQTASEGQALPFVRASYNAPEIGVATSYALADRPEAAMAITPEVPTCDLYVDWGGHLTPAGYATMARAIADAYQVRFGLPPPSPSPSPSAIVSPSPPPTSTPNASPGGGNIVVDFNTLGTSCCPPMPAQYPVGTIQWNGSSWTQSPRYGALTTPSISFTPTGTSGSFTFLTAGRILIGITAYNGASAGSSSVTIACAGQATSSTVVAAGAVARLVTNWATPCATVTLTSSNGWNVNFDDLIYR